jgi:hypothetical protein
MEGDEPLKAVVGNAGLEGRQRAVGQLESNDAVASRRGRQREVPAARAYVQQHLLPQQNPSDENHSSPGHSPDELCSRSGKPLENDVAENEGWLDGGNAGFRDPGHP